MKITDPAKNNHTRAKNDPVGSEPDRTHIWKKETEVSSIDSTEKNATTYFSCPTWSQAKPIYFLRYKVQIQLSLS